ncbi:MAG: peptide ABC transporter ATP-binding protein [Actinobacteria bacterium RBG_13_35_12]|uniref:Peptide ABC transporter ATP-binding protein n=1 Tax=Candidatus Sediminicultor quintus TaxID=1797291 RepID=A0A1F5A5W2_9BACT|nr:MAG: peptide ABC transporter ATP-binding protein [Actinobacteria bacterium RBG_13_35_12]OGD13925.1 MAG: peptide ABC transporter ATP-binding protein [Candidatus Atribacteria bacterium RBG_19FT_COMBO_35_14]
MENSNILTIKNLKKYFFTQKGIVKAVNDIDISIKEGEILGLVGESGSGKTTVAYTVVGLYSPTSGEIIFRNQNIGNEGKNRSIKLKQEIQIVFQDPGTSLNPARNIYQILEVPLKVHGIKNRDKKIKELLQTVEIPEDYIHKYPQMIGGGERQMISIARALASNPSLLILDEPTSALDVSIQAKIINMLLQLQKNFNLSYLFITHDLSLMRNIASTVSIMYLGKICESAKCKEFFEKPLHPYTQMLLSSIPVLTDAEEDIKPKKVKSIGEIPSPVNIPSGCSFHSRCSKKMDICSKEDPIMAEISAGHFVRCHLFKQIEL